MAPTHPAPRCPMPQRTISDFASYVKCNPCDKKSTNATHTPNNKIPIIRACSKLYHGNNPLTALPRIPRTGANMTCGTLLSPSAGPAACTAGIVASARL